MKFLVFSLGGLQRNVCYETACRSTIGGWWVGGEMFFFLFATHLHLSLLSFHTSQSLAAANVPLLFFHGVGVGIILVSVLV